MKSKIFQTFPKQKMFKLRQILMKINQEKLKRYSLKKKFNQNQSITKIYPLKSKKFNQNQNITKTYPLMKKLNQNQRIRNQKRMKWKKKMLAKFLNFNSKKLINKFQKHKKMKNFYLKKKKLQKKIQYNLLFQRNKERTNCYLKKKKK